MLEEENLLESVTQRPPVLSPEHASDNSVSIMLQSMLFISQGYVQPRMMSHGQNQRVSSHIDADDQSKPSKRETKKEDFTKGKSTTDAAYICILATLKFILFAFYSSRNLQSCHGRQWMYCP